MINLSESKEKYKRDKNNCLLIWSYNNIFLTLQPMKDTTHLHRPAPQSRRCPASPTMAANRLHLLVMRNLLPLICLLLLTCSVRTLHAQVRLSEQTQLKLQELDNVIEHKEDYRNRYVAGIDSLKRAAARKRGDERIRLYRDIYHRYARFQTDSASAYLDRIEQQADTTLQQDLRDFLLIGHAEVLAVTGQYAEAMTLLAQADPNRMSAANLIDYYHLNRTLSGWTANYVLSAKKRDALLEATRHFRDSIIKYETDTLGRNVVIADKAIVEGDVESALRLSLNDLKHAGQSLRPYIYFNLALCYQQKGNTDQQIYYLASAAITDIQRGVTEYEALGLLAQELEKMGEVKRAYDYLICTMEDATYCKARLRTIEASNIFPIIDKAYKQEVSRQQRQSAIFTYILISLTLCLIAGVLYLFLQKRRLSQTRRELASAYEALKQVNTDLQLIDKIKEEYIVRYLNRCRNYIDTLENYRRDLLRMAKAHQTEQLYKVLNSGNMVTDEKTRFYADFDSAFLTIYPNFIEKINALLLPEAHILPKKGEMLSTELRIFALIRLGVNDSAQIAHFLNYSLTTIYNYRSKYRGKAICGKDLFEEKIMEI